MTIRSGALLFALVAAAPAAAQETREQKALDTAKDIVQQPVQDVGIDKVEVPEVLSAAVAAPYAMPARGCRAVQSGISDLNGALGADLDVPDAQNPDVAGRLAEAGGRAVVNSLIPFRGLVREISGAAPAERRLQVAVEAGLARRGFLRGVAIARGCSIPAYVAPTAAPGD